MALWMLIYVCQHTTTECLHHHHHHTTYDPAAHPVCIYSIYTLYAPLDHILNIISHKHIRRASAVCRKCTSALAPFFTYPQPINRPASRVFAAPTCISTLNCSIYINSHTCCGKHTHTRARSEQLGRVDNSTQKHCVHNYSILLVVYIYTDRKGANRPTDRPWAHYLISINQSRIPHLPSGKSGVQEQERAVCKLRDTSRIIWGVTAL